MFDLRANGWNLNVQFEHEKFEQPVDVRAFLPEVTKERYASHISRCYIFSPEVQPDGSIGETVLGYGIALCSVTDNFSYEHGREEALKAALKENPVVFDKATRTAIWNAYFKTQEDARLLSRIQDMAKHTAGLSAFEVEPRYAYAMDKVLGNHDPDTMAAFVDSALRGAFELLVNQANNDGFPTLEELKNVPPIPF